MSVVEYIGNKIKEFRQNAKLSQAQLAARMKTAANTISRWETGTYKPTVEDLEQLSRVFEVSILKFFPEGDSESLEEKVHSLARAAQGLDEQDITEVGKFIEFRKAQKLIKSVK